MATQHARRYGIAVNQPGTGRRRGDAPVDRYPEDLPMQSLESSPTDKSLTTFLGWFSIGLGLFQLIAPRTFNEFIGVRGDEGDNVMIARLVGLREITAGVGIFAEPRPVGWTRSRVAGDVMDLALLDSALMSDDSFDRRRTILALISVLAITAVDLLATQTLKINPKSITSGTEEGALSTLSRRSRSTARLMRSTCTGAILRISPTSWATLSPSKTPAMGDPIGQPVERMAQPPSGMWM
jgi:hypothetical protein